MDNEIVHTRSVVRFSFFDFLQNSGCIVERRDSVTMLGSVPIRGKFIRIEPKATYEYLNPLLGTMHSSGLTEREKQNG